MADEKRYTTGELADACGVTVRTVQYYDKKGLMPPADYSEGGRRLYTEQDVERLNFILMLKFLGLGLTQIKGVLESPNRDLILKMLLKEQAERLQGELDEREQQLSAINATLRDLELYGKVLATTESAMVVRMEDEKARRRWFGSVIIVGVLMDAAWISPLIYGILTGIWWPFPIALIFVALVVTYLVRRTLHHSTCLCPNCGAEFMPNIGEYMFASHTLRTRKLTCPCCGKKDWCVEHYHADEVTLAPGQCTPGTCRCREESVIE